MTKPERDRSTEPSSDTEIRAMMAVKRSFEQLDRSARRRVLEWASHRYVDEPLPDFDPDFTKNLTSFTEGLAQAARQIGNITPLDIIRAANEIARIRDEAERVDDVEGHRVHNEEWREPDGYRIEGGRVIPTDR